MLWFLGHLLLHSVGDLQLLRRRPSGEMCLVMEDQQSSQLKSRQFILFAQIDSPTPNGQQFDSPSAEPSEIRPHNMKGLLFLDI